MIYLILYLVISVKANNIFNERFDFVIVGAGTAGSVLANRLTEVPHWKVLLLEVGPAMSPLSDVPMAAPLLTQTWYNWNYKMQKQAGICEGCIEQKMVAITGKSLGGTSGINYMSYTRGNPLIYDRWSTDGNEGWSYLELLPYFKKSEKSHLLLSNPLFHGLEGPLSVENSYQSPVSAVFIAGMVEMGVPLIDLNSNASWGVGPLQAMTLKGRRVTSASAYLNPIRTRNNLSIITGAYVTKILIDEYKRAYAVEFDYLGFRYKIGALKEVLLCAGVINSPQLLMLSGIGPRLHLEELKIPVIANLPVGQNLQDHFGYYGLILTSPLPITLNLGNLVNLISSATVLFTGKGPLSSLGGLQATAFVKTKLGVNLPDMELLLSGTSLATDYGTLIKQRLSISKNASKVFLSSAHKNSFQIIPSLLMPKSKGFLKLQSADPFLRPLIYGNYLSDPDNIDIDTLVLGIRLVQDLTKTLAFKKSKITLSTTVVPGCESFVYDSDDYWKCAIRVLGLSLFDFIGTVKMGPDTDGEAVVCSELKVWGVRNLRVVDASVIPYSTGAHVAAATIMIAEKAADMIKKTWEDIV